MDKEKQSKTSGYKASLKSMDTEETFDLIFYRPIGYMWALLAKALGIKPNAITIASIFLGIGAGVLMYYQDFWLNVAGCLLLIWANSFDSADGQLARMTHQYSRIGRILDGMSGDIWFVTIYVALCLRENITPGFFMDHKWVIWVMAVVTGAFHALQASMADYYRQFHLYFLKGEEGSELDSAADLLKKWKELSWSKDFWRKITLGFYANYTHNQEKRTGDMQRLRAHVSKKYGSPAGNETFRQKFLKLSRPLMKYTNILSFNTRCFALFISLLVFRMPWLYFAFELTVLNIILLYMYRRHESICRRLVREDS